MNNWKEIIESWLAYKKSLVYLQKDIFDIFQIALENTMLPDKSWFGYPPSKSSFSILFGKVFLIGIFDKTIEIIVDANIENEIGFKTRIVGSSIPSGLNLYWISTDINNIKLLIDNKIIWQHYRIASFKVNSSINISSQRNDWTSGKYLVKDIFSMDNSLFDSQIIQETFERKIRISLNDGHERRIERLKLANKKPIVTTSNSNVYIRNEDVVAEVLQRANNNCEYCNCKAPFIKDSDGNGYLEVHHIIPLSENGDDTVDNAVALCPNCHKHAHFGKRTFEISRIKKYS